MTVAFHASIVSSSAERVYRVYEDPQNITLVTGIPVQVLAAERPVRAGSVQRFAVGPPWLRIQWEATIEQYTPPHLLVDVQRRGPFHRFRHAHYVVPIGADCSAVVDIIEYEWRPGRLGRFVERVLLHPLITLLLRDRHRRLAALFRQSAPARAESNAVCYVPEEVTP